MEVLGLACAYQGQVQVAPATAYCTIFLYMRSQQVRMLDVFLKAGTKLYIRSSASWYDLEQIRTW